MAKQEHIKQDNRRATTTIRQIAKLSGVSIATVSRVLNEPEVVKPATRERVQQVIRKQHFVADGLAGGLSSQRSRTIGLVIPTIANSIYASSTQAVHRVAQRAGYTVLVGVSDFSRSGEETLIHQLLQRRVDGLVLTGADRDQDTYEKIRHNNVPHIITWRICRDGNTPSISFDNYKAAAVATNYLISLGHRRIGLICGRTDVNDRAYERRRAYEDCMQRAGLEIDLALVAERNFDIFEGRAAMARMIANTDRPTAVFCANDIQAIGAITACHDANLKVPEDISIIGFDDLAIAQCTTPQLTTIRVPADEMGARATNSLINAIRAKGACETMELPTELVVRGSTATYQS